jgi:hypothetical protein
MAHEDDFDDGQVRWRRKPDLPLSKDVLAALILLLEILYPKWKNGVADGE